VKLPSVFNNVIGPVMRGPSSSHTAASYHIGRLARDILGAPPVFAAIIFDEGGSYGKVYKEQGSDKGFISGLLDFDILDGRFHDAPGIASREGAEIVFKSGCYKNADHPNWVRLETRAADGRTRNIEARSVGGGSVVVTAIDEETADLRGDTWVFIAEPKRGEAEKVTAVLSKNGETQKNRKDGDALVIAQSVSPLPEEEKIFLENICSSFSVVRPIFHPIKGTRIFSSAEEWVRYARDKKISAGEAALEYECALLGMTREEAMTEMLRRYGIMKRACERALAGEFEMSPQLLRPVAGKIMAEGTAGKLPFFGFHSRAAARAMAIMHANGAMDVVVAAPTGGSAGALPGAVITLEEEMKLSRDEVCLALFAAGGVGVILDTRATFAAEVAGCQVEIGAGGAMASAACVEAAGGNAASVTDAASIAFQNTMGSVCDPVQGIVEIPCHTRNAVAAASAFVNADMTLGGYENGIPLDEAIDAVFSVGKMLPPELRCTSLGGLSLCPSALAMKRLR
jgi:L-serine dehydratase